MTLQPGRPSFVSAYWFGESHSKPKKLPMPSSIDLERFLLYNLGKMYFQNLEKSFLENTNHTMDFHC
jgi:hypothetical protein